VTPHPVRQILTAIGVLGLGQGAVFVCGLATVKVLSVVAGPAAVGAFAVVRSAQQMATIVGSFGGDNWIAQGVARRSGQEGQVDFMRASWWLLSAGALVVYVFGMLFLVFRPLLDAGSLHKIFSPTTLNLTALAASLGILLIYFRGQLLARLRIGAVARVNAYSSITALVFAYPVARFMSAGQIEWGAILILASLGVGLATAWTSCQRLGLGIDANRLWLKPMRGAMADALRIAGPTVAIFAAGATTVFLLRAFVTQRFGVATGGVFDTAWTLSTVGLGLLLTTISSYLLPATAGPSSAVERASLFEAALRITILIAVPAIVFVVCTRGWLIRLLYTRDFLPATEILRWMLVGDYLKATAWIVATLGYARGHILAYGIIEVIWGLTVIAVSLVLVHWTGSVESFGIGYLAGYACYATCWIAYAHYRRLALISASTIVLWIAGLLAITLPSLWTWHVPQLDLGEIAFILAGTAVYCLAFSSKSERQVIGHLVAKLFGGRA